MKTLKLEQMENIEGGGCPWWTGSMVGAFYGAAGILCGAGPAGAIIAVGGFISAAVIDYACSNMK